LVPVVHWSMARPAIPPRLPLMASSIASIGDLAEVSSGSQRSVVVPVPGVSSAGGATQGAFGVGVVGAGPQLGDDAGSSLWELVMHSAVTGVPGSVVLGDAALALGPQVPQVWDIWTLLVRLSLLSTHAN
jgi:hypothetical protein